MTTKNKTWLTVLIVVTAVVGASLYLSFYKKTKAEISNIVVTLSPSSSSLPTPRLPNRPPAKSSQSPTPPNPATCNIFGSINFLSPTVAENFKPTLAYTGIDNKTREIKWNITPKDALLVGPNISAPFVLPDGESPVGVTLPASPVAKKYTLTALIQYGRLSTNGIGLYETNCSSKIDVMLSY